MKNALEKLKKRITEAEKLMNWKTEWWESQIQNWIKKKERIDNSLRDW